MRFYEEVGSRKEISGEKLIIKKLIIKATKKLPIQEANTCFKSGRWYFKYLVSTTLKRTRKKHHLVWCWLFQSLERKDHRHNFHNGKRKKKIEKNTRWDQNDKKMRKIYDDDREIEWREFAERAKNKKLGGQSNLASLVWKLIWCWNYVLNPCSNSFLTWKFKNIIIISKVPYRFQVGPNVLLPVSSH